ncbi:heat-shock protein [Pseudomonas sp. WN033]|nr:heat-shock protein [Pseudomonas sp. WN033]
MNSANDKALQGVETARLPAISPAVDVLEDSEGITLLADMPGVTREQLQIDIEGDTLTLAGEISLQTPEAMEASHVEWQVPRYRRVFTLSRELDRDAISARLEQGVLHLRIPKLAQAQPRRIVIEPV